MNRLTNKFVIAFIFCCTAFTLQAQEDESSTGRISPKELSIPPSPVFDFMGVTPSQINHTSDIRDFKVDWSFKSWKLNPNLALQSQPIWEIVYNRKELSKYQRASRFMHRLSSLDVSVGTVQDESNDRRIGFALKLNLYKEKDPLLEKSLYTDLTEQYKREKEDAAALVKELKQKLDTIQNVLEKPGLRLAIKSAEEQYFSVDRRRQEEIHNRAKIFAEENWNASWLDVAFGRVYTYKTDSAGSLKSLKLNRNTGKAIWINGGVGIGKKGLVTGLFRLTDYEEQLDFNLRNKTTGEETTAQSVAGNKIFSGGINLRYGNAIYNFFAEFLYETKTVKTIQQAIDNSFTLDDPNMEIVSSTAKWTVLHPYTISIGGDWRISKSVIINYGMRCLFDKNWKFQTFTPVVAVSCMMR